MICPCQVKTMRICIFVYFLISLNPVLLKNIAHVWSFKHFLFVYFFVYFFYGRPYWHPLGGVNKDLLAPPGGVNKNLLAPPGGVNKNLLAPPRGCR